MSRGHSVWCYIADIQGGGFTALGAYPPPAQNASPTAAEKGRKAAITFAKLLEEGGHSVEVTERMDAVRYQKASLYISPRDHELTNRTYGTVPGPRSKVSLGRLLNSSLPCPKNCNSKSNYLSVRSLVWVSELDCWRLDRRYIRWEGRLERKKNSVLPLSMW
jgi:hypothetical protein